MREPTLCIDLRTYLELHYNDTSFVFLPHTSDSCSILDNIADTMPNSKDGDTLSSRHVSSCDITRAVGMLEAV
jgi:hypothetical protein